MTVATRFRAIIVPARRTAGARRASLNHLSERLRASLSALASERDRLAQVLERERSLVRTQKEFVANVSHELRTPLTYVEGYSEAILNGLTPRDEERKAFLVINDEARRLRRLVGDLLDLTAVESGQASFHPMAVDVSALVRDVLVSLGTLARAAGIETTGPPAGAEPGPWVWVDPDRTKQVLVNLVDNAIRHAPRGTAVRVSVECQAPSGSGGGRQMGEPGQVWVRVRDEGPGLDPETMGKVWDRFFKVDRSRKRDTSGTGLGLAIVKSIVEAQGGKVAVASHNERRWPPSLVIGYAGGACHSAELQAIRGPAR